MSILEKVNSHNKSLEKTFSNEQIIDTEKTISKWLHFLINESGHGKIEIFIDSNKKFIDVNPTPYIRIKKEWQICVCLELK